jgi:hypothetical protein
MRGRFSSLHSGRFTCARESFYGHAGRPGKRGGSAKGDPTSKTVSGIVRHGGITIGIHGNVPTSGYAVAGLGAESILDGPRVSRTDIQNYVAAHHNLLSQPHHYIGAWVENNKVYLDVSEVTRDRAQALNMAHDRNELAVFDLAKFESVYTMSDHQRPKQSNGQPIRESESTKETGTKFLIFGSDQTAQQIADKLNSELAIRRGIV